MNKTKHIHAPLILKDTEGTDGTLSAVFSVFNMVDSDGDVVLPSTFTAGQSVPMVWSHDWARPVGRGQIEVTPEHAVFNGRFFTETRDGMDAYLTVKAMSDLQEFSWGFRVLDAEPGEMNGQPVRFIKRAEVFEVSPVLVGANRETYTLDIKSRGLSFTDHAERAVALLTELSERAEVRAALRAKEGREISESNRRDLATVIDAYAQMGEAIDGVKELLRRTERPAKSLDDQGELSEHLDPPKEAPDIARELAAFLAFEAGRNGVAVGV